MALVGRLLSYGEARLINLVLLLRYSVNFPVKWSVRDL